MEVSDKRMEIMKIEDEVEREKQIESEIVIEEMEDEIKKEESQRYGKERNIREEINEK